MDGAWIVNGTITNASIANATIDNAKIIDLTADKIKTGFIDVDTEIKSTGFVTGSTGWRIKGNGTAEFDAAHIRGQLDVSKIVIGASSISYSAIAGGPPSNATAGANLVRKPNFSDGLKGLWGGAAGANNDPASSTFGNFLIVNRRDTLEDGSEFSVVPGETFFVEADITGWASPHSCHFGLRFLNAVGETVGWGAAAGIPANTGWTRVKGSLVAPTTATIAQPWIQIDGPNGQDLQQCWLTNLYIGRQQLGATLGADWHTTVLNKPTTLAALDATAASDLDGKTVTFYQNEPPAGTINDLWFDTNDGNMLYRHDGSSWVLVRDSGIAAAALSANSAQTTANSKITTFYSTTTPTPTTVGDLWYNTNDKLMKRWTGSAWVDVATIGAPTGTYVGSNLAQDIESIAGAQAKANAAQAAAIAAAEAYALAKANLAKEEAIAWADGEITAEEARAIADAQTKANNAQAAAIAAAAIDASTKANVAATTANWSGVVDTGGKPADNADITQAAIGEGIVAITGGIDLYDGASIVTHGTTPGNYSRLSSGDVEVFKNVPNVGVMRYKALTRMETGVATNNTLVTIPGYFTAAPKVIVSPAALSVFDAGYANQSQSLLCTPNSITESSSGSMVWRFTPTATLNLAAASGSTSIGASSGAISADNWTSNQYTTPANCTSISPNVTLASYRGNGASQYFYRTVRWRVEYNNGGTWINGSWTTINLPGDTSTNQPSSASFAFPSSGTWTYRIRYEAYDTSTSLFGSVAYDYATTTSNTVYCDFLEGGAVNELRTLTVPLTASIPSGYSAYSTTYTATVEARYTSGAGNWCKVRTTNYDADGAYTATIGTWDANHFVLYCQRDNVLSSVRIRIYNGSATIYSRKPQVNSTTPVNNFSFTNYNFSLSSAQVLATGTLNWIALGD
jgi:hypothetical protein